MAGAAAKDIIANRYRLIHELGKGGMGTVWKAHDDRLNRAVALKLMAKRLLVDKTAVDRFEREAKAVARLLSPHIVQIYDYGIDPQPFMVMELLKGENVSQRLARLGQLSIDEVAMMMRQSARGLEAAHEAGIVHRDLKPGNLFIVHDRDTEFVKVVDFGIAKAVTRQVTLTAITTHNQPVGTPQYMSPDQLRANEDHRDDVWALAVIAYKALSGVHPFASESLVTLVQRIMDDPHEPITAYEPTLPAEIDALFEKAFAKDREQRYQSAGEFADAFDALITAPTLPPEITARRLGRTSTPKLTTPIAIAEPAPTATLPSFDTGPTAPPHLGADRASQPPLRTSQPDGRISHPMTTPHPHGEHEPTTELTLQQAPVHDEDQAPTLVASEITQISDAAETLALARRGQQGSHPPGDAPPGDGPPGDPRHGNMLHVPTPTPPPAAGTPWPVAYGQQSGVGFKPIALGIALSVVAVGVAMWVYFPGNPMPADARANRPAAAEIGSAEPAEAEVTPEEPEPTETDAGPASPSASGATSSTPPESSATTAPNTKRSGGRRVRPNPGVRPQTHPSPVPRRKRRKGDEAFEGGPF